MLRLLQLRRLAQVLALTALADAIQMHFAHLATALQLLSNLTPHKGTSKRYCPERCDIFFYVKFVLIIAPAINRLFLN
jgi:hypothetical protein